MHPIELQGVVLSEIPNNVHKSSLFGACNTDHMIYDMPHTLNRSVSLNGYFPTIAIF